MAHMVHQPDIFSKLGMPSWLRQALVSRLSPVYFRVLCVSTENLAIHALTAVTNGQILSLCQVSIFERCVSFKSFQYLALMNSRNKTTLFYEMLNILISNTTFIMQFALSLFQWHKIFLCCVEYIGCASKSRLKVDALIFTVEIMKENLQVKLIATNYICIMLNNMKQGICSEFAYYIMHFWGHCEIH